MKPLKNQDLINIKNLIKQFVIYADLECLIEKIDGCKNCLENSSTTKVGKNIPSDFSMFAIFSFKNIKNMHDV